MPGGEKKYSADQAIELLKQLVKDNKVTSEQLEQMQNFQIDGKIENMPQLMDISERNQFIDGQIMQGIGGNILEFALALNEEHFSSEGKNKLLLMILNSEHRIEKKSLKEYFCFQSGNKSIAHTAAYFGDFDTLQTLKNNNFPINQIWLPEEVSKTNVTENGILPLSLAIANGHLHSANKMITQLNVNVSKFKNKRAVQTKNQGFLAPYSLEPMVLLCESEERAFSEEEQLNRAYIPTEEERSRKEDYAALCKSTVAAMPSKCLKNLHLFEADFKTEGQAYLWKAMVTDNRALIDPLLERQGKGEAYDNIQALEEERKNLNKKHNWGIFKFVGKTFFGGAALSVGFAGASVIVAELFVVAPIMLPIVFGFFSPILFVACAVAVVGVVVITQAAMEMMQLEVEYSKEMQSLDAELTEITR